MIKECILKDIAVSIQTGPFGSQLHSSDYSEEGTPVVMPQDILNGEISELKIARVENSHVQRLSRHKLKQGEIIYPRRGDLAKCAFITSKEENWLCGTGCLKVKIDETKANPKYVYFHLQLPYSVSCIENATIGSTMPNLNTSILGNVKLRLPNINIQNKIVDILSEYDELIAVNRKKIQILEEMAMRTYREWFVHMRFPGHETTPIKDGLPEGWKYAEAQSFFKITIGKTPPRNESQWFSTPGNGTPWLSIADMSNTIYSLETAETLTDEAVKQNNIIIIPKDTILLSFKLTVGRVVIAPFDICTNEAIAHFPMTNKKEKEYTYCYLKTFNYQSLGSTSSLATAVNSKIIKRMPFIMPTKDVVDQFHHLTKPLFDEILFYQQQNRTIQQMRDKLLPQLMSGKFKVKP